MPVPTTAYGVAVLLILVIPGIVYAAVRTAVSGNAAQLGVMICCQRQRAEDLGVDCGLVVGSVDVAFGAVFGDGAFDHAWADPGPTRGLEVGEHGAADLADEVDGGLGDDAGGVDYLVAGGVQGDGEAGPVRAGQRLGGGGVGDGQPQRLVGDQ